MTRMRLAWLPLLALLAAAPARADEEDPPDTPNQPAAPSAREATPGGPTSEDGASFGGPIWDRNNLFGDPGGVRSVLAKRGLTFGLEELAEVLGNATGGTRRGTAFEGLLAMSVGLDTQKAGLWPGGTFNASAYQIHGRGLGPANLANSGTAVSGIEAQRGTLLYELWYEQVLLDRRLSLRVGQLAADQEFMLSTYSGLFINNTFGWSALPSEDLPSGGAAFPLATPGVRLRASLTKDLAVILGVFNGNPAGPGTGNPQSRDASGTAFRVRDGVSVLGEVHYAINSGEAATGLPGTYKLGAWYNSDRFADQRLNGQAVALAIPNNASATLGRGRRGNYSLYAIADQLVYRPAGTKDEGIGVFLRIMGAPGDRNLINLYVDAGVTWKGVIPGRDSDTVGLAFGLARISDTAIQFDKDTRAADSPAYPLRRHQSVLELTYQAQVAPWLQVQPTAQYLFNLNGGVVDPVRPGKRLGDAAVFGVRSGITF